MSGLGSERRWTVLSHSIRGPTTNVVGSDLGLGREFSRAIHCRCLNPLEKLNKYIYISYPATILLATGSSIKLVIGRRSTPTNININQCYRVFFSPLLILAMSCLIGSTESFFFFTFNFLHSDRVNLERKMQQKNKEEIEKKQNRRKQGKKSNWKQ